MEFDDINYELIISNKVQYLEPLLTVSTIKHLSKIFRQSLVLELYWEKQIKYKKIEEKNKIKKISRLNLLKKFISKNIRSIFKK